MRMPEADEQAFIANFLSSQLARNVEWPEEDMEILRSFASGASHTELAEKFDGSINGISQITLNAIRLIKRTIPKGDRIPGWVLKPETARLVEEVFKFLDVDNFRSLSQAYSVKDQELMKSHEWDDENSDLATNQAKCILEQINPAELSENDRAWWHEIMWFWYHHAISCAIWKRKDKALARQYADKALAFQMPDHPNRITKLLRLLVHDEIERARNMVDCLMAEAETARLTLAEYERGGFFK